MIQNFDKTKFKKFETSTDVDGNYAGLYEDKVLRIIVDRKNEFKEILKLKNEFHELIESSLFFENEDILVLEHSKLDFITYYEEWTEKQRLEAAISILMLQNKLSKHGFYLKDPHSFNITFEGAKPVYFDYGSIYKGSINSINWIVKNFMGGLKYADYWRDVLKLNSFQIAVLITRLQFADNSYVKLAEILNSKITRFESNAKKFTDSISKLQKIVKNKKIIGGIKKSVKILFPKFGSAITNWTDYEQKDPQKLMDNIRTKNFLGVLKNINPKLILDIGANKGAYSKLALENGVETALCADLDENSLNILRMDIEENNLPIWTAKLNLMNYNPAPGCYKAYAPIHERWNSDFVICFAVTHHLSYFGDYSFDQFAESIEKFSTKYLLVEFIPYTDIHLSGANYKGKDKSWYTKENFIAAMMKYFPGEFKEYESFPNPRILFLFSK